ncbi:MAG: TolC family protein [Planctomycetes bacterium]|nr:TolC family protein [Planctomycetota bacterium]
MPRTPPPHRRRCPWPIVCLFTTACVAPLPDLPLDLGIAAATGIDADVHFATAGTPRGERVAVDANAAADPTRLELATALRRAVTNDASLRAALARVHVARAEAAMARTLPNPVLTFVTRWGNGQPEIEASLAGSLLALLQRPQRARAADAALAAAAAEALGAALDVAAEVATAYADAQAADRLLAPLAQRAAGFARLGEIAASRQRLGEGANSDVTAFAARRIEAEIELEAARQHSRDARLRLAACLGEPASAAAWVLDDWTPPTLPRLAAAHWQQAALTHRPELLTIAWRLAALGDERALARTARWLDAEVGIDAQRNPDLALGPSLSLPLPVFDRGRAGDDRAAAMIAALEHEHDATARRIVEQVRRAAQACAGHRDNLQRVRDQLLPLQQQRRQLAEAAFRLGHGDATTLLLAEQDLAAAEVQAIELERELSLAGITLRRALGGAAAANDAAASPSPASPTAR